MSAALPNRPTPRTSSARSLFRSNVPAHNGHSRPRAHPVLAPSAGYPRATPSYDDPPSMFPLPPTGYDRTGWIIGRVQGLDVWGWCALLGGLGAREEDIAWVERITLRGRCNYMCLSILDRAWSGASSSTSRSVRHYYVPYSTKNSTTRFHLTMNGVWQPRRAAP